MELTGDQDGTATALAAHSGGEKDKPTFPMIHYMEKH